MFGTCVPEQRTNILPSYSTFKLPATGSSETLVVIYKTIGVPPQNILCLKVNLKLFKSRLVTKHSKLKLYRTVIRPIVTYASDTWVLQETIIQKLLVFERKILRRIFGPTKENQIWRVKTNEELDKLIKI